MNIVMITENDPAGMGIAFTNAINCHTDHNCRLITTKTRYNFNFEKDIHVPDLHEEGFEEIIDLLQDADIIHFHILADENIQLGPINVSDFIRGKAIVHHHHGHPDFRVHSEKYRDKYRRLKRTVLVSTPDLLRLAPEASWQPNLVPIDDPLLLPSYMPKNGCLMIGQSVTRKDLKNTADLLDAVGEIKKDFSSPIVKVDIIENTDHRECLRRKSLCHVIFDHMQGYYGVSSLESLSQGKPVIAGLDEWNLKHVREYAGTSSLPWILCRTKEELSKRLDHLLHETEAIRELGQESRNFMRNHWSDRKIVGTLVGFFKSV